MFCINCGNQVDDGSKFCPSCGAALTAAEEAPAVENTSAEAPAAAEAPAQAAAPVEAAPAAAAPVAAAPAAEASAPAAKKPSRAAVIGFSAVAAVALIAVAAVLFIAGVFSGPSGKVGAAVEKTFEAYKAAYDELGGFDAAALIESEKFSQSASFTINSIEGDSTYEGLGVRANLDIDLPGQSLGLVLTPFYESADIAAVQAGLDGTKLYAMSPELTDGKFYGIDTATLGKDIAELADDDSVENLSFNIFEVCKTLEESLNDKETQKAAEAAAKEFLESIEVEKTGKEEIEVNDNTVKATAYAVVIPVDAIEDYLEALEDAVDTDKLTDAIVEILESIGLPDEIVDDFADELAYTLETDSAYAEFAYLLDGMDDIELTVFVSGGRIAAVEYEGEVDGEKFTAGLYLGGGKNYVDDLSFVFEVKGEYGGKLVLASNGDHSGKSGVFTDKTKLTMKENGSERETLFSSEFEYNKKDGAFELEMDIADEVNLRAEGTMKMDKSSFELVCSELVCTDTYWEEEAFDIALGYSIGEYKRSGETAGDVAMVLTMDEDELEALGEEIAENAEDLLGDLDIELPGFAGGADVGTSAPEAWDEPAAEEAADYSYDDPYQQGYCIGYHAGYEDGWVEVDYDDSGAVEFSYYGDMYSGYIDGYADGYNDGYPGNSYGYSSVYDPYPYGYDAGYSAGYQHGWDEVDYDDSGSWEFEGEAYSGFVDGYAAGYDDGFYAYDYGYSSVLS